MNAMPSPAERYLAKDYADKIERLDVAAFAWLLGLQFDHDDAAGDAKKMIVDALRLYAKHR